MYPKHGSTGKKAGAREQLAELLTNKFRNRYSINLQTEGQIDQDIAKEIQKVVHQEASVSERDLNELDKRINQLVSSCR